VTLQPGEEVPKFSSDFGRYGNPAAALSLSPSQARIENGVLHAAWSGPLGAAYLVRLSDDGGTWRIVALNLRTPRLELPIHAGPTEDLRLEVLAIDAPQTQRLQIRPILSTD